MKNRKHKPLLQEISFTFTNHRLISRQNQSHSGVLTKTQSGTIKDTALTALTSTVGYSFPQ